MLLFTGIALLFSAIFSDMPVAVDDRLSTNLKPVTTMDTTNDSLQLSAINAKFINNFLTRDVASHDAIIHQDFVCIQGDGSIISREVYLKNWATDLDNSGYLTFTYADECIRIFGDIALVRSKTIFTKAVNGKNITGYTIYTDTYKKENGNWKCIQVQITPVK
ncbi:MAG: nuclear transport factor 2 family protein [Chitinophagaceae bacterium]|nr:nuclear transport factor 2 family protein [Chitinophagaceae bacterium]